VLCPIDSVLCSHHLAAHPSTCSPARHRAAPHTPHGCRKEGISSPGSGASGHQRLRRCPTAAYQPFIGGRPQPGTIDAARLHALAVEMLTPLPPQQLLRMCRHVTPTRSCGHARGRAAEDRRSSVASCSADNLSASRRIPCTPRRSQACLNLLL